MRTPALLVGPHPFPRPTLRCEMTAHPCNQTPSLTASLVPFVCAVLHSTVQMPCLARIPRRCVCPYCLCRVSSAAACQRCGPPSVIWISQGIMQLHCVTPRVVYRPTHWETKASSAANTECCPSKPPASIVACSGGVTSRVQPIDCESPEARLQFPRNNEQGIMNLSLHVHSLRPWPTASAVPIPRVAPGSLVHRCLR